MKKCVFSILGAHEIGDQPMIKVNSYIAAFCTVDIMVTKCPILLLDIRYGIQLRSESILTNITAHPLQKMLHNCSLYNIFNIR